MMPCSASKARLSSRVLYGLSWIWLTSGVDPGLVEHPLQVRRLEVGDTDGPQSTGLQQRRQPADRLDVTVLVRVRPVHQQQVDVVHAEPFAAGVERLPDAVDAVPLPVELRGDEDLGAVDPGVPDALADAVLVAVVLGGVDQPVAGLDRGPDRRGVLARVTARCRARGRGWRPRCAASGRGVARVISGSTPSSTTATDCRLSESCRTSWCGRQPAGRTRRSSSPTTSPSATSEARARSVGRVGPGRGPARRRRPVTSLDRSTASSAPRHCRSVPSYVWPRRGGRPRPDARRGARRTGPGPGTARTRRAGGADQRAQLHRGHRPASGPAGSSGSYAVGQASSAGSQRRRRAVPERHPGQHPADVGVQHDCRCPYAKSRWPPRCRSRRRAGCAALGEVGRHLAAEPLGDGHRRPVQPQRPARVAQPAPGPDRLAGRRGGQGRRGRPALQPGAPRPADPRHRRLLQHELADHDRPRRGAGPAPGQVAGVLGVPVEDPADHRPRPQRGERVRPCRRHAGHRTGQRRACWDRSAVESRLRP